MNVLILEDNEWSRLSLEKIVRSCGEDIEVFSFERREDAYLCAMENRIDLFLVDIILESEKWNDNSGIDFADNMRKFDSYKLTPIIFITTLQGMEFQLLRQIHCYDYIEKPIGDGTIVRRRVQDAIEAISLQKKPPEREKLILHYDGIGYALFVDEIIYISNHQGVLDIYTPNDHIQIPNVTTKSVMRKIKYTKFLEPVYGTAVNEAYIERVDFRNREVYLKCCDTVMPIGGRKLKKFREEYMQSR